MSLPKYKGGVKAGKITDIEMVMVVGVGLCPRMTFENGSEATLIPAWAEANNPQVGSYFVTDHKTAWVVPADKFDLEPEE